MPGKTIHSRICDLVYEFESQAFWVKAKYLDLTREDYQELLKETADMAGIAEINNVRVFEYMGLSVHRKDALFSRVYV